ncbi:MAG: ribonucleoside-diphosphate reductase, partial [Halobacteria archaeon]|nr:ribonucleoside-diphosphate reductase [Halobacteria archaeon]
AMHRLLDEDTPENRVKAYTHYHLTIEGILAQTGDWGLTKNFDGSRDDLEELPGLVEGIKGIRSDEGRHVGFGMAKVKEHIESGEVGFEVVQDTIGELLPLVQDTVTHVYEVADEDPEDLPGMNPGEIAEYAIEKHTQRMGQISDVDAEVPDVEELTALDD